MKRKRDGQRAAVYRWEWAIRDRWPELVRSLTLEECHQLIHRVWDDYRPGETPPEVTDGRGCRRASGCRFQVKLPRWARSPLVALHEVGHSLQPNSDYNHGPGFAQLLLELWGRYAGLDVAEARRMGVRQRPRRVQFATAADARPPSKAWQQWYRVTRELKEELRIQVSSEPPKYS